MVSSSYLLIRLVTISATICTELELHAPFFYGLLEDRGGMYKSMGNQ